MRGSPETLRLPPPPMGRSRKQLQCPTHRRSTHCDFLASTWIFASQKVLELLLDFEYYCLLHVHQHFRNTLFVLWHADLLFHYRDISLVSPFSLVHFDQYYKFISRTVIASNTCWSSKDCMSANMASTQNFVRVCSTAFWTHLHKPFSFYDVKRPLLQMTL